MTRTSWKELQSKKLSSMTVEERREYDQAYAEAQLAAVEAGLGIAQLATWLANDKLRTGRLIEVLADFATDGLPLFVIWQRARQLTPKVAGVLDMLRASLAVR